MEINGWNIQKEHYGYKASAQCHFNHNRNKFFARVVFRNLTFVCLKVLFCVTFKIHQALCAAHLLVKVFPVILGHQSKQRQEGPTKRVKAGVTVVWVLSHFDARVPLRTLPAEKQQAWSSERSALLPFDRECSSVKAESDALAWGL